MVFISNKALGRIALYGGVFALGSAFWIKHKIQSNIKDSDFYKTAMSQLRSHKGVVSLLGEPIRDGDLDLGNSEHNHCDGLKAQFHVPVRGPQNRGILHFWASRETPVNPWQILRSELELKDDSSRRLIIVKQKD